MTRSSKVVNFHELVEKKTGEPSAVRNLDPEEFHVPVSDSQGHSERFQFRGMKQIKAMVNEIIQTQQFPYRSDSDLHRHALVRHLHWLTDLGYIGNNTIFSIEAVSKIGRADEIHQAFLTSIEKMQDRVNFYRQLQDEDGARELLEAVIEEIKKMPDNGWKKRYEEEINRRFGKGTMGGEGKE